MFKWLKRLFNKKEIKNEPKEKVNNKPEYKPIYHGLRYINQPCEEIKSQEEVNKVIKELRNTLQNTRKGGIALSANQIGINKKVSVIRYPKYLELINPVILEKDYSFKSKKEACLSLPTVAIDTKRYGWIKLENGYGEKRTIKEYSGMMAMVIQHETDHLNGKTIYDNKFKKTKGAFGKPAITRKGYFDSKIKPKLTEKEMEELVKDVDRRTEEKEKKNVNR